MFKIKTDRMYVLVILVLLAIIGTICILYQCPIHVKITHDANPLYLVNANSELL